MAEYSLETLDEHLLFFAHDEEGKVVEAYFVHEVGVPDIDFGEIKSINFLYDEGRLEVLNVKGPAVRFEVDGQRQSDVGTEIFATRGLSFFQSNTPREKKAMVAMFSQNPVEGCQSGGVGAVSCSHSNMGRTCKVSCAAGYFACCNTGENNPCLCVAADDFD